MRRDAGAALTDQYTDNTTTGDREVAVPRRTVWGREPVNTFTHLAGFLAAIPGLVALLYMSAGDPAKRVGMAIYGSSLVLVFLASTLFHYFGHGPRGNAWLRRFDHTAIFLMIAGSYTPALLLLLDGAWRVTMLSLVAAFALCGVLFKLMWINAPDWLGVTIYLAMGWLFLIPAPLIIPKLSTVALALLVTGGAAYTVGAFVYLFNRPNPWPGRLGSHEIWHLFVLAGAAAHFGLVWQLLPLVPAPF